MIIPNNTHYYCDYSRLFNRVPDTNSFSYESSKRMGYFQRLYFEMEYTKKVNGQAFYYTFTYNNKSIPYFHGFPVFDYEDIRLITNGSISKALSRKYGSRLRYFLVCESGEGKGKRGLGNNPHYHVVFFVQPLHDDSGCPVYDNYKKIDAFSFRDLCLNLWQGTTKWIDWRKARFGHVQEGDNLGVVDGSGCFSYLGKYILKDDVELSTESKVRKIFFKECMSRQYDNRCLLNFYYHLKYLNIGIYNKQNFFRCFALDKFNELRHLNSSLTLRQFFKQYSSYYQISPYYLHQFDTWFRDSYVDDFISFRMSEFKNRYSGKVRCSKDLGIYGLQFINNIDVEPSFVVPTFDGWKVQHPCLFYIRKLYFDVCKCPVSGNPLYVLNQRGRNFKLSHLEKSINSFITHTQENISCFCMNGLCIPPSGSKDYFDVDWYSGKVSIKPFKDDSEFYFTAISDVGQSWLLRVYSIFHHVYEFRCYNSDSSIRLDSSYLLSHVLEDYDLFLCHNFYFLDYQHNSLSQFPLRNLTTFSSHPLFKDYVPLFNFLDKLNDVCDDFISLKRKLKFKEKSEHQHRLSSYQYNQIL